MTRSDRVGGLGLFLVSLLSFSVPSLAHAGEGDVAAARALFTEARKLAAAGDYAAACPQFADSYKLDPGIGTSFNLADCEEHLGRTASAWLRFLDVAASTKAAGQPDRERVARARADALAPRVPKLIIKVPWPVPRLVVRRDGDVVPQNVWGVVLPIDPGEHALEAAAPGRRKWTGNVTIAATPELASIVVPALEVAPETQIVVGSEAPPTADGAPASSAAQDKGRKIPRLSLWLGGFGAASLATGTVFAVLMELNNAQAEKLCTMTNLLTQQHNLCSNQDEEIQHGRYLHTAERDRAIYYVAAGVGAASVIVAGAWWWRSSHLESAESKSEHAFTVAPMLSANGAQVGLEATW